MHLQAKGRSGSDTSKLSCCTRRSYIFRIFSRYNCLLHTSINYMENVRIFTRMRKQWIPGALLRFFKRLGMRLERLVSTVCACTLISKNSWKTVSLAGISVTLTSVRLPIFTVWKMHTTTTLCVNDDEGAMKVFSFSVARMIYAFVHSS